jgi:phage-related protein
MPAVDFAAGDSGAEEPSNLVKWISGAGLTLVSGIVVWARKNFKNVFQKIKEIIEIPIAIMSGLSKISTEIAQASGSVTTLLNLIESFAENDSMTVKELVERIKAQKDEVVKEMKDIPASIDEAIDKVKDEINDLTKKS